jgi:hypothetical protein
MLQLSKSQYKDLCTECASRMMVGIGVNMSFPPTIPEFSGTDISFWVEDPELEGGGFMDTLKSTWNKVKEYIGSSKLAQNVVKKGIEQGKKIARGVADEAVEAGVEYLPGVLQGPAKGLATKALNTLESRAQTAAEEAILGKQSASSAKPTGTPAPARNAPSGRRGRLRGSGYESGLMAPHPLSSSGLATAPAWNNALAPAGSMIAQTPRIAGAY